MALSVYRADGHRKKGHATPALLKLWSTVAVVGVSTQPRPELAGQHRARSRRPVSQYASCRI